MSIVIDSEDLDCSFREQDDFRITNEEDGGGGVDHHTNSSSSMEQEKRLRREIANSNERRRMQSINAGFQSLKNLLPHHEGEKLSKAAILQQTAEYVYTLEQEKTHLLSQNCQLKRLIDQSDAGSEIQTSKKRKFDNVMTMQTISDSSDEGLGSMSPEPVNPLYTVLAKHPTTVGTGTVTPITSISVKEYMEIKHQLELERRGRINVEEQLRQLEAELYPERIRDYSIQYQEVIEHTDNIRDEEEDEVNNAVSIIQEPINTRVTTLEIDELHQHHHQHHHQNNHQHVSEIHNVEVLQIETIPTICQTQVVGSPLVSEECISPDSPINNEMDDDDVDNIIEEIKIEDEEIHEQIIVTKTAAPPKIIKSLTKTILTETIEIPVTTRLQPILEAAIKAEPKVEVERINSPATIKTISRNNSNKDHGTTSKSATPNTQRMYVTSTSRQNLETIVEAIRHLEGDSLFGDVITETIVEDDEDDDIIEEVVEPTQDVPLALTTTKHPVVAQKQLQVEMNSFLQFRQTPLSNVISNTTNTTAPSSSLSSPSSLSTISVSSSNPLLSSTSSSTSSSSSSSTTTPSSHIIAVHYLQQQCRPGVIVGKQTS